MVVVELEVISFSLLFTRMSRKHMGLIWIRKVLNLHSITQKSMELIRIRFNLQTAPSKSSLFRILEMESMSSSLILLGAVNHI
jgi:hypothetical protein